MKATELMPKDWVMLGSKKHQCYNICGHTNHIMLDNGVLTNVSNLEPISLTPEILEKSGFAVDNSWQPHTMWMSADHRIMLHNEDIYLNTFNKWHVHVDTEDMRTIGSIELTYVHQFQQFLRLCGMNELADNFKI